MEEKDDKTIIKTWIQHEYSKEKSLFWAKKYLNRKCLYEPQVGWRLILGILKYDKSDKILPGLAAGPMEDLLSDHGKEIIEQVKEEARTNDRFNYLLGGVWQNRMDQDIWEEIQRIRKVVW